MTMNKSQYKDYCRKELWPLAKETNKELGFGATNFDDWFEMLFKSQISNGFAVKVGNHYEIEP